MLYLILISKDRFYFHKMRNFSELEKYVMKNILMVSRKEIYLLQFKHFTLLHNNF